MDKKYEYNSPLVYQRADPFVYLHTDGYYYFTGTMPQYDCIEIRRAKTLNGLLTADSEVVWKKHTTGEMGSHIWAPELHYIDGVWYIYFTAGDAKDVWEIRPYLLMCEDENPMTGKWIEKGRIDVGVESFSLDMTTFIHKGEQYVLWAQKTEPADVSDVYIAKMKNPWTLATKPMILTTPEYDWEVQGFKVNEGPAVLVRNGKVIVTYSASDTGWRYCMGMLWADENSDLLDIKSWHKSDKPVFKTRRISSTDRDITVSRPITVKTCLYITAETIRKSKAIRFTITTVTQERKCLNMMKTDFRYSVNLFRRTYKFITAQKNRALMALLFYEEKNEKIIVN